jgi:hypothetical protein
MNPAGSMNTDEPMAAPALLAQVNALTEDGEAAGAELGLQPVNSTSTATTAAAVANTQSKARFGGGSKRANVEVRRRNPDAVKPLRRKFPRVKTSMLNKDEE